MKNFSAFLLLFAAVAGAQTKFDPGRIDWNLNPSTDIKANKLQGLTLNLTDPTCTAGSYAKGDNSGCGTPVGSGTVNSGTANQLAYYGSTGAAVSGSSMLLKTTANSAYFTLALPTITGAVSKNIVFGTSGAGSQLAPGAGTIGGQNNVILGNAACPLATSMREAVCIGEEAGAQITGNGTGADDMIGVYIGSLAASHLTNLGGSVVAIGQKAGIGGTNLSETTIVGVHGASNVVTDLSGVYIGDTIGETAAAGLNNTNMTIIGSRSLSPSVSGGTLSDDTCVGKGCFANLDGTGSSTGFYNTAIGSQSGGRLGQGTHNNFFGFQVGSTFGGTITGSYNTIIGGDNFPGRALTSGTHNFIVDQAAQALTTGSNNVCMIGTTTCGGITTGSDNIMIGAAAAQSSGNQSSLILLGRGAGFLAAADGLVGVGRQAGHFDTGAGSTFLGNYAGTTSAVAAGASGANITALGDSSCSSIGAGTDSECLGHNADIASAVTNSAEIGTGQNTVSNTLAFHGKSFVNTSGALNGVLYTTATNCSSSAGPAVCAAAPAGSVVIAAAGTTVTVNTTAVTANSQIFVQEDSSLGTKLGVTCNTTVSRTYAVTARTAGTSFVITTSAAPTTNPACLSYSIVN